MSYTRTPHSRYLFVTSLMLVLILTAAAYRPGLSAGFLFDDATNLKALGAYGPVHDLDSLLRYLTSGTADPTGRPVALLSFLVDAQDWPADPAPFKRSNLILHLLNIGLLALLLQRLTRLVPSLSPLRQNLVAIAGAAFWGLHPLLVSTTLYVVQREAMLPATFTLLGLLAWLQGRTALAAGQSGHGSLWILATLPLFTLLATLSKANGALLPLLVGTLEFTVLAAWQPLPAPQARHHRRLCLWLLLLPSTLLLAYLIHAGVAAAGSDLSGRRPWTLGERLLTQPRVLLDYLSLLWVPRPYTTGLFNDAYPVSRSVLAPASTLPALLLIVAMIAAAWALRRRQPVLAAALLFYFGGQLMESSSIPLELYFEHRNYLPALLMFWPLALALARLPAPKPYTPTTVRTRNSLAVAMGLALILGLAGMTRARADLWGNTAEQAQVWAALNPDSGRAQAFAAQAELALGRPDLAIQRLERALDKTNPELQLALNLVDAYCALGQIPPDVLAQAESAFAQTRNPGGLLAGWLGGQIQRLDAPRCVGVNEAALLNLLSAAERNPRLSGNPGRRQDLWHLKGLMALRNHDGNAAAQAFSEALAVNGRPEIAMLQAGLLGAHGFPQLGLQQLDQWQARQSTAALRHDSMAHLHQWLLRKQGYWAHESERLRLTLGAELANAPASTTEPTSE